MMSSSSKPVSLTTLANMKAAGEKIVCLTAYDASFAQAEAEAGVEVILIGDSLGMVIQGQESTLPVRVEDMIYHASAVARARTGALLVVDMPFQSYATVEQAIGNGARLMGEGAAQVIKLEGGEVILPMVEALSKRGMPVCGHLGLTPQSVHKLGGYKVQGKGEAAAQQILSDAKSLQQSGAVMLVLECVPTALAAEVSQNLDIPVIGIGAGAECDGQVLVLHDLLGLGKHRPRFVKDFMQEAGSIEGALGAYVDAVKDGSFPGPEHGYST